MGASAKQLWTNEGTHMTTAFPGGITVMAPARRVVNCWQ
jgi:hypothetical protein